MTAMTGKTVLITGASRGIGEASARLFAEAGANVVLVARSADRINAIAREIGGLAITADVAQWSDVKDAVDGAVARYGQLDVFIGNAGVIDPIARIEEANPDAWGVAIDVNLKGVFHGMRAAIPVMKKQGGGTIITISSGAAYNALEGWSHYCASKAGALMMTKAAHKEVGNQGIRVLGLSPGTVATQMQRDIKASGINPVSELEWEDHIPPEWPARALVWMCSAEADAHLGADISLRDDAIRKQVGLT